MNRPGIHQLGEVHDDGHTITVRGWRTCGCCRPWTVAELRAVLRDVADVRTLESA